MKYNCIVVLIAFFSSNISLYSQDSQECNYDSVEFKLIVKDDTIRSLDLIHYQLSFTNKFSKEKTFISPWNEDFELPFLEIRFQDDTVWKQLLFSDYSYGGMHAVGMSFRQPKIILSKDTTISINKNWLSVPFSYLKLLELADGEDKNIQFNQYAFNQYFKTKGLYKIRAALYNCRDKKVKLFTNEVTLTVVDYQNRDKGASEWLKRNMIYPASIYITGLHNGTSFIDYTSMSFSYGGTKEEEILKEFIGKFPTSSFTPWAKLYIARWKMEGFRYEKREFFNRDYTKKTKTVLITTTPTLEMEQEAEVLLNEALQAAKNFKDETLIKLIQDQIEYLNYNRRYWNIRRHKKNNNK